MCKKRASELKTMFDSLSRAVKLIDERQLLTKDELEKLKTDVSRKAILGPVFAVICCFVLLHGFGLLRTSSIQPVEPTVGIDDTSSCLPGSGYDPVPVYSRSCGDYSDVLRIVKDTGSVVIGKKGSSVAPLVRSLQNFMEKVTYQYGSKEFRAIFPPSRNSTVSVRIDGSNSADLTSIVKHFFSALNGSECVQFYHHDCVTNHDLVQTAKTVLKSRKVGCSVCSKVLFATNIEVLSNRELMGIKDFLYENSILLDDDERYSTRNFGIAMIGAHYPSVADCEQDQNYQRRWDKNVLSRINDHAIVCS